MFKNASIYRIGPDWDLSASEIADALAGFPFHPCGPTQTHTCGWVPPREETGALVESIGGHQLLKLRAESKTVPTEAIDKRVTAISDQIEEQTGRRPGRKQRKEIKEQALLELLPAAFPKTTNTCVWLDRRAGLVIVDAASASKTDMVITQLTRALVGLQISNFITAKHPEAAMASWLLDPIGPPGFSIDRECVLQSSGEIKSTVRYSGVDLDCPEVREHVTTGKVPTLLAMTWESRVSFVLNDHLQLRRLSFLDVTMDAAGDDQGDAFDADFAIVTGELTRLLPALTTAMGGVIAGDLFSQDGIPSPPPAVTTTQRLPFEPQGAPSDSQILNHTTEQDPLLEKAIALVVAQQRASISLVQRHLQLGYNRAARLMEAMEMAGIISPMDSSGSRRVLTSEVPA